MELNYVAVLLATVAQFICGAVWYTFFFGKLWGRIHGFDKLPKATQEKMTKEMGPIYGYQFLVTLIQTFVLAIFITNLPGWNAYGMAGFFWLGFIVPTQASAAFFGGTESKWIATKIAVQAGASLVSLLAAAFVLSMMI